MTKSDMHDSLSNTSTATNGTDMMGLEMPKPPMVNTSIVGPNGYVVPAEGSNKTLGIVHPSGKMLWVNYNQDWTTLDNLKQDISNAWCLGDKDFQVARATPLLSDALIDHQCMDGEILCLLPKVQANSKVACSEFQPNMTAEECQSYQSQPSSNWSVPMGGDTYCLPLDEKLAYAAFNLLKVVGNPKQCTELQGNLELACSIGVDCSLVFQKVEENLGELITHPAGNYLVSKCFDYYPGLINVVTDAIVKDVKAYALHKHASYIIEAILLHPSGGSAAKSTIISEIFSPQNRVAIATHDSGNFVIQKAVEVCPDELLPMMVEGVSAVSLLTCHGAKMQKKVQARMSRRNHNKHHGGQNSMRHQAPPPPPPPAPVHQQQPLMDYNDPYDPSFQQQVPSSGYYYGAGPYAQHVPNPSHAYQQQCPPVSDNTHLSGSTSHGMHPSTHSESIASSMPGGHSNSSAPTSSSPSSVEEETLKLQTKIVHSELENKLASEKPVLSWADDL
eukprot:TRINITY_DN15703_c0_g1_i1.p1 TRINITY_DN15703_c0_g1~~TRINITY_DN15703_c0_g1_i1.p1  ORF type:complete len:503 (+),score=99.25 TRINITY_DN15703_c0_g1_i1:77-1585(+)